MSDFQLRPYQQQAIDAVLDEFNRVDSTLIEAATGTGKTEIAAGLINRWENGRIMFLAHTKELIDQAASKFYKRMGEMPEIEQGDRRVNHSSWCASRVVVASKDSLHPKRLRHYGHFGLIITDEAHHAVKSSHTYQRVRDHLRGINPHLKELGITATAARHDGIALGTAYQSCAFRYPLLTAISEGWLLNVVTNCVTIDSLDLSNVSSKCGELNRRELAEAIEEERALLEIADVAYQQGADRLKTLVFCASVGEAEKLSEILSRYGVKTGWVCGDERKCSREQRERILAQFRAGHITCLLNCAVLTEGFDEDTIEHIVMAGPTKSIVRYAQMLGRGTRPLKGTVDGLATIEERLAAIAASAKPHVLITDLVDNSHRHKLVSTLDVLGGNYNVEEIERAKEIAKDASRKGGRSAETMLSEARDQITQEKREQQLREREERLRVQMEAEERERRRRQEIRGEARFRQHEVDIFGDQRVYSEAPKAKREYTMPYGKHKGVAIKNCSTRYLEAVLPYAKFGWLRKQIGEVLAERKGKAKSQFAGSKIDDRRSSPPPLPNGQQSRPVNGPPPVAGQCTPQQAAVLKRFGKPTNVSREEAARYIGEINREIAASRKQREPAMSG